LRGVGESGVRLKRLKVATKEGKEVLDAFITDLAGSGKLRANGQKC